MSHLLFFILYINLCYSLLLRRKIQNFAELSIIPPQPVELWSLVASVNTKLVFETLKHKYSQFIMDTTDLYKKNAQYF